MTGLIGLNDGQIVAPATFARKPVAAVSGIARPDRFIADLEGLGMEIALRRDFDDHHRYPREEFLEIVKSARRAQAEAIITTEKDAANLSGEIVRSSALPVFAARIEFGCENESALKELVRQTVRPKNRNCEIPERRL
jgi:tetraacyldisaccharide-1-P 4'-kinase